MNNILKDKGFKFTDEEVEALYFGKRRSVRVIAVSDNFEDKDSISTVYKLLSS